MGRATSARDVAQAVKRLLGTLDELRSMTGRRFTLDGVALGDLGEAVAAAKYGVRLNRRQSQEGYDGLAPHDGRRVEVKITQGKTVAISAKKRRPDHLLAFHLEAKTGRVETVYNGPADPAWEMAGKSNGRGQRRLSLAALKRIPVPTSKRLPLLRTHR